MTNARHITQEIYNINIICKNIHIFMIYRRNITNKSFSTLLMLYLIYYCHIHTLSYLLLTLCIMYMLYYIGIVTHVKYII